MDWLDLLAEESKGLFKSLLQHHSSKASILRCSAFFTVQLLSHPYMTTGKTIALTRRTFFGKVMCMLFNMLSRLVITFLPRSKCLLISWQQSPSAVSLEPRTIWFKIAIIFLHFLGSYRSLLLSLNLAVPINWNVFRYLSLIYFLKWIKIIVISDQILKILPKPNHTDF